MTIMDDIKQLPLFEGEHIIRVSDMELFWRARLTGWEPPMEFHGPMSKLLNGWQPGARKAIAEGGCQSISSQTGGVAPYTPEGCR